MPRKVSIGLLALGLLLVLAGCTEQKSIKITPQAKKFRQEILHLLKQRVEQAEPLAKQGHASLQKWLDGLYSGSRAKDVPLHYETMVLGPKATLLAWQGPRPSDVNKTGKADLGQSYSHFNKLDPVYNDHQIANFKAYTSEGEGFAVCTPVLKGEELVACFCLGFDPETLKDKYGIDGKQFLALNFN